MTTARNSRVLRTIPLLIAFCFVSMPAQAQYSGGTGEPNNPYQIATAEDLNDIGNHEEDWDKCFILVNDIDLSAYTGTQFNVIGRWFGWSHPDNKAFSGVFDGDGKVIRNFTWSSVDRDVVALFAFLDWNGTTVKNLGLEEVNIRAENGGVVAALAARSGGEIANCYVTGYISGRRVVGGLVAYVDGGSVVDCYSLAVVEGDQAVGGLVGSTLEDANIGRCYSCSIVAGNDSVGGLVGNCNGSLRYSFSNSTVTGDSSVGGLVGVNRGNSRTVYCYARGSVTGTTRVGGLAGSNDDSEMEGLGLIHRCYSSATVRGEGEHIGGLVGWNEARIISCFWDRQASGMDNMCGEVHYGVDSDDNRGKTTAEMQIARTFFSWSQCDLEVTWTIDEGNDYPRLWWENQPGEPIPARLYGLLPGSGTEDDPYLIYTAEELNLVGLFTCDFDRYFKLMADVDLSAYAGAAFNIIGESARSSFTRSSFRGVFDGNGKKISNFTYTSMDRDNVGLFGYVEGQNAEIEDLGLIDPNIDAPTSDRVGALVGHLEDGTLSNCYVRGGTVLGDDYVGGLVGSNGGSIATSYSTGAVTGSGRFVGGLVGYNDEGSIVACYSNGVVSGDGCVGGLAGRNCYGGNIAMSYSTGTVSGTDWGIGGLVGQNSLGGSITTSYSTSAVSGYWSVGGLVGRNSRYGSIATSFSTGTVTGNEDVGGFVGRNQGESAVVSTCFWDTETSGLLNMCGSQDEDATGCDDSYGKTTAEMQTASTFLEAGWDFVDETVNGPNDIWRILEGQDYPRLWWEKYGGGSGEPNDPYQIATAEDLNDIGNHEEDWDKCFILVNDIDLSAYTDTQFNVIGRFWRGHPDNKAFSGIFDGNGKVIRNFTWSSVDRDMVALFAFLGRNANGPTVKNLGLENVNIRAEDGAYIGALVALNNGGLANCYVTGYVLGENYVGGLVGHNDHDIIICHSLAIVEGNHGVGGLVGSNNGDIDLSFSHSTVSGIARVGGLVGTSWEGDITYCYSSSTVSGLTYVGGLVGDNGMDARIIDCYASGSVAGTDSVGGLVGKNSCDIDDCEERGEIQRCYSTAIVLGDGDAVGGLVGWNEADIISCFWDTEASGMDNMCGDQRLYQVGCNDTKGKTTAEMRTASTYFEAGWDFVDETANGTDDIWWILEGQDYPRLWWEASDL